MKTPKKCFLTFSGGTKINIGLKWDKQLSAICSLSVFTSLCYYKFLCQSEVKHIFHQASFRQNL